jgi:hypothetical protein
MSHGHHAGSETEAVDSETTQDPPGEFAAPRCDARINSAPKRLSVFRGYCVWSIVIKAGDL